MNHLHVHDAKGSFLDSTIRPSELPKRAKELGMSAVAITNHGYLTSVIEFYKECKKENIKPIIGCEVYVCDDMITKDPNSRYDHLVLLAKNKTGYENLTKIVSEGFTRGFYYKPRVDLELLQQYSSGLIALSACLGGDIPRMILNGKSDKEIENRILTYTHTFDDYFLEIQSHDNENQKRVNEKICQLAKNMDVPIVATSDVHFLNKEDFDLHGLFIQINQNRDNEVYQDCWLKSEDEVMEILTDHVDLFDAIESVANTHKIADMCNVEIELGHSHLPNFPLPKGFKNENEYLRHLINKGFVERGFNKLKGDKRMEYINRLKFEYDVITKKGYSGYFLIVQDFLRECRARGILVGDGRGSADNSLVCYTLGITNVDSIKFDLEFSRFLTIERTSLPDIDSDLPSSRKQDAVNILRDRYGHDNVAQICTIMTLQSKAVIESIAKVMKIPHKEVEKIKKYIPDSTSLNDAIKQSSKLKKFNEKYPELFNKAIKLEGLPRGISIHAGGVVICPSDKRMNQFTALGLSKDKEVITHLDMHDVEEVGLVKLDALGVSVLDIISDTLDMIY